jgi:hypothetical protein
MRPGKCYASCVIQIHKIMKPYYVVKFVFTAVKIKIEIFGVVMPYSVEVGYQP